MPNNDFENEINREVPAEEDYYSKDYKPRSFRSDGDSSQFSNEEGFNPANMDFEDVYSDAPSYTSNIDLSGFDSGERRERPRQNEGKKKKSGVKKRKLILAVILVLILLVPILAESVLGKINYDSKTDNQYISAGELRQDDSVFNLLLLGVDARSDEKAEESRADSMMLISVDSKNHKIKMVSFLRDTWVYIPVADRSQRLNAASAYGGYAAVADTIEYNFGVKIDGYAVADFEMFKTMVDSIGGVKVNVTPEEAAEVTNHPGRYGDVVLDEGEYKLTGEQALAYCRIRKIDTDWKRTERQRTVIQAILSKTLKSGPVGAYKMANAVAPFIETNLTKGELRALVLKIAPCIAGGFEQTSCPFEGTWEYANKAGASVISIDKEKNREMLIAYLYE